jgi:hypothetical protein
VSLSDDEVELLELPEELEGLPYATKRKAFGKAQAQLDLAGIIEHLGAATADQALVLAAAHYLATTGNSNAQPDTPPRMNRGVNVGEDGARGLWAGSPYGDALAVLLARMPGGGGATRRCSHSFPSPAPA